MKKMSKGVDAHKVGLGLAITSVILYFACLLFVLLAPEGVVVFVSKSIFHAIAASGMMGSTISMVSVITGFAVVAVYSYAAGALFAVIYNKL